MDELVLYADLRDGLLTRFGQEMMTRATALEALCALDIGGRGIAVASGKTRYGMLCAASSIAEHPSPRVGILTGFYISSASPPAAETDGPIGSAILAAALNANGIPVTVVTDRSCQPVIAAALDGMGLAGIRIALLPEASGEGGRFTHIVSIERPGAAADGKCYSMRGDALENVVLSDEAFSVLGEVHIGIGDGGNEIGMGSLPIAAFTAVPHAERIVCRTAADFLIVSGVSNWGAIGLGATLALVEPCWKQAILNVLDPRIATSVLERIVRDGAVDGVTRVRSLSVDGFGVWLHEGISSAIRAFVR